jgi:hypothetical protein
VNIYLQNRHLFSCLARTNTIYNLEQ